jgi:hypothetical protein
MEAREFAKYHTWCDQRGIRVYPMPTGSTGEFNLAVERNGIASVGQKVFYDKPSNSKQESVWNQIGILLKAIVYKELQLMEIKSTYNQLEGICAAAIKQDREKILFWLTANVPFREAMLYLEGFYPEHKECAQLIYELAHCQCGEPIKNFDKPNLLCANCGLKKGLEKIEYSKKV